MEFNDLDNTLKFFYKNNVFTITIPPPPPPTPVHNYFKI